MLDHLNGNATSLTSPLHNRRPLRYPNCNKQRHSPTLPADGAYPYGA